MSVPPTDGLRRPIFAHLDRRWGNTNKGPDPLVSVTDGRSRVFIPVDDPESAEFYDLATDPTEQMDLAADRPEELATYRTLSERYLADDEPPWGVAAGTVEIEEMQLNQLKALGYRIEQ